MPRPTGAHLIALVALGGVAVAVDKIDRDQSNAPDLYAFRASAATWTELGLGTPLGDRQLYVGKAENTPRRPRRTSTLS